jgi:hypothetical protein
MISEKWLCAGESLSEIRGLIEIADYRETYLIDSLFIREITLLLYSPLFLSADHGCALSIWSQRHFLCMHIDEYPHYLMLYPRHSHIFEFKQWLSSRIQMRLLFLQILNTQTRHVRCNSTPRIEDAIRYTLGFSDALSSVESQSLYRDDYRLAVFSIQSSRLLGIVIYFNCLFSLFQELPLDIARLSFPPLAFPESHAHAISRW